MPSSSSGRKSIASPTIIAFTMDLLGDIGNADQLMAG